MQGRKRAGVKVACNNRESTHHQILCTLFGFLVLDGFYVARLVLRGWWGRRVRGCGDAREPPEPGEQKRSTHEQRIHPSSNLMNPSLGFWCLMASMSQDWY